MAGADDYAAMRAAVMEIVREQFRPEFINRVDEVVVFHSLDRGQLRAITKIQVDFLARRLAARDIALDVDAAVLDKLGEAGFDPVYGARPLKRAIQQQLENPLAEANLAGRFGSGDTIRVTREEHGFEFTSTG
jgi:ATP-dependent Clp protease ATP-binding subunit ClpB